MYQGFQRFCESVISMNKRFDAAHQILTGGQGVVSSSLATRTSKKLETERFRAFLFCFFSIALGKHVATVPFQNFGFKKVSTSYCSTAGRKDIQIKYLSGRTTISIHIVNKTERGVELGCWGRL